MKYSDVYISNHDIDWFCIVNGTYIHVASAGGSLPSQINDDERLRQTQHQVGLLQDIYSDNEIEFNEEGITAAIGNDAKGRVQYVESFAAMARKGFASFDRSNIEDPSDNRYHLVCKPNNMDRTPEHVDLPVVNIDGRFPIRRGSDNIDIPELLNSNRD